MSIPVSLSKELQSNNMSIKPDVFEEEAQYVSGLKLALTITQNTLESTLAQSRRDRQEHVREKAMLEASRDKLLHKVDQLTKELAECKISCDKAKAELKEVTRGNEEPGRDKPFSVKLVGFNGQEIVSQRLTFDDLLSNRNFIAEQLLEAEKEIKESKRTTSLKVHEEYCDALWNKIVNTKKPATIITRDGMVLFAGIADQSDPPVHCTGPKSRKLLGMPDIPNLWSDCNVRVLNHEMSCAIVACKEKWQE